MVHAVVVLVVLAQALYTLDAVASSAARPHDASAAQRLSKVEQQTFCRESHPLKTPNVTSVDLIIGLRRKRVRMHVYQNADAVSAQLLSGHAWEAYELQQLEWALAHALPVGSNRTSKVGKALFVDIGANVGAFTLALAAQGYEVMAFEGMRDNQMLIRSSLCDNSPAISKMVTLYGMGLSTEPTTCFIVAHNKNKGDGITRCGDKAAIEAAAGPDYPIIGMMQMLPLDSFVKRDVHAMKLDVEGFEPMVLGGAQALLSQYRVWFLLVEFNTVLLRSSAKEGGQPTDFVLQLHRLGYSISTGSFVGPFLSLDELQHLADEERNTNLYCVHQAMAM